MFFRQTRVGRHGKPFTIVKLQTLRPTDRKFATPEEYTRWGHTLRKYKIDELPQLWNVLKGEMRLVGPRPDTQDAYDLIPEEARKTILSVSPGMTSLASISFHNEEEMMRGLEDKYKVYFTKIKPNKIVLDCFYVENRGFLLDVWILYRTFCIVLKKFFK